MRAENAKPPISRMPEFARFLRRYVNTVLGLTACVMGPLSKYFHLIPIYADHENLATGIVSVYGLILAAALFHYQPALSGRPTLAKLLPATLILVSIASLVLYAFVIQDSIQIEIEKAATGGVDPSQLSHQEILARTGFPNIPHGMLLVALYLIGFFGAESALLVLALLAYQTEKAESAP
jgi:hypothetical protein